MIVDSSALAAILLNEEDAERYKTVLSTADECSISAANVVELGMVLTGRIGITVDQLWARALEPYGITIVPTTATHARIAIEAFARFGKGRHRAGLNFGDCFAYALAKATGRPLLFKGDDFQRTDVASALTA